MSIGRRHGWIWFAAVLGAVGLASVVPAPGSPVEAASTATVTCDDPLQTIAPQTPALESYSSIVPKRIVDTRDGVGGYKGILEAGCTLRLRLNDSAIPSDAGAAALSVAVVSDEQGFVTVFPCASGRPATSNINARPGVPTANLVVAIPDVSRDVCMYSARRTHLVVDLQGWWGAGPNRFRPVDPVRAFDTRLLAPPAKLAAGSVRNVPIAGPFVPENATSVVINLTATQTSGPGWLVVYPCGEVASETSNLNFSTNDTRAVAAVVGIGWRNGGQGQICIKTPVGTHAIVDVVGYYGPVPDFGPSIELLPMQQRLLDTRFGIGPWNTPFAAGEIRRFDPTVGLERGSDATALVINAVGLSSSGQGFLTFYPCSDKPPEVSTLNTFPLNDVSNLLTVKLSATGALCVLSSRSGHVVLDLIGMMVLPAGAPATELNIGGVEVWPDFTVDGTDYAMNCQAGVNAVTVRASAHRERAIRVGGTVLGDGESGVLQLSADDLFSVEFARPGVVPVKYNFRCLPDDFPNLSVERPGAPQPGWYLTGLGGDGSTGAFVVIFDDHGAPVWYQRTALWAINPQRLNDGSIMYDTSDAIGYGVGPDEVATIIALNGEVLRGIATDNPVAFPLDHHELLERPGGWTMLSYPLIDGIDVSVLGPSYGANEKAVGSVIREVTDPVSNGVPPTLEWEWDALDHFDIAEVQFPQRFNNHVPPGSPGEVDLFHINSLDRQPDGDYIVSARHLDAVFRVDRDTGDVQWILSSEPAGGVVPNKNGAPRLTVIGDPLGGPRRQHDARLVGDILTLFDNRIGTGDPARAVAYRIDAGALTATLLWQIDEPVGRSSFGLGAVRVGPDQSRLVTWGGLQPMLNEFSADGELLLSIQQGPAGSAYRFVKYDVAAFNIDELRSSAAS